jgi:hypothetical protein
MIVAWLLFPLVLLAGCLGCGLLVERICGWQLPGGLLPSVGLALVIVAATLTTSNAHTAPLTTAVVVVLAVAGYATSWQRLRSLRPERWSLAVGLGVFAVCAAPVVASGNATFLGYFVLNDSEVHFSLIDQLLAHGHDLAALTPNSLFFYTVHNYLATSYPTGADVALGAVRPLVGQDLAWIFQPYIAVMLALGGVALYELLQGVVRPHALRAGCAFIAAQAGLVYAFYLEASIKELATTWIITVTVVMVLETLRQRLHLRSIVALLVATVAGLDIIDLAIVPWLGPPLAVFVVTVAWRSRHAVRGLAGRRLAAGTAVAAGVLAALAAPIVGRASTFFQVTSGVLTQKHDLGNLFAPLKGWQILGIWPAGDFRAPLRSPQVTYVLIGVAIAGAILGVVWMLRRRALAPLLLLAGNGIATVYLLSRASPYATAKVMVVFSVTAVLTAMLGAVALHDAGRRAAGYVLAAVIGGGVLWTNGLAYHHASVAPRARFAELASIGRRFSDGGPILYNLADLFAVHFLRNEAPIPATGAPPLRPGLAPSAENQAGMPWDPDELSPSYVQSFPLLVLGRSPSFSRPPADFQLVHRGRYYDVWQRTRTPQVLEHISLGQAPYPEAAPSCRVVTAVAARARREHARLDYVARPRPPTFLPTQAAGGLVYDAQQPLAGMVRVEQDGRYQVWLQGSFSERIRVWVGRRLVGSLAYQLGPPGQSMYVGRVALAVGMQPVLIEPAGSALAPGEGGSQLIGPLMLARDPDPPPVSMTDPRNARLLCGQPLDWLEIVR